MAGLGRCCGWRVSCIDLCACGRGLELEECCQYLGIPRSLSEEWQLVFDDIIPRHVGEEFGKLYLVVGVGDGFDGREESLDRLCCAKEGGAIFVATWRRLRFCGTRFLFEYQRALYKYL